MPLFVLSMTEFHCPCIARLTHNTHLQMFANCTFFNCSFVRGCVASPSLPSGRKHSCHKTSIMFGFDNSGSGRFFFLELLCCSSLLLKPGSPAALKSKICCCCGKASSNSLWKATMKLGDLLPHAMQYRLSNIKYETAVGLWSKD